MYMSAHFSVFRSPVEGDTPSPNTTLGRLRHLPDPVVYWDCTSLGAFTFASILPPSTHATRFHGPFTPNILLLSLLSALHFRRLPLPHP